MGQTRFERKSRNFTAVICEPSIFKRAQAFEAGTCLVERRVARWIGERKAAGIALAPNEACQEQAGEIGFGNFRRVVLRERRRRGGFPKPDRNA